VIPFGFEPKTYCLEGSCSIQLSYGTYFISIQQTKNLSAAADCSIQLPVRRSKAKAEASGPNFYFNVSNRIKDLPDASIGLLYPAACPPEQSKGGS
jgi:hypothetical protein